MAILEIYKKQSSIGIFNPLKSEGAVIYINEDGSLRGFDGDLKYVELYLDVKAKEGLASLKEKK